ncbi:hypothetical protein [Phenylobacterium sp.]|uniref:hypothetical protein n=1 Tax=Phenylobacterium sp. TaxID=1871053 RepID=UPI0025E02E6D|nr:hypothetical protein [Phenylobacterium sp.]MBX3484703.1 hypothetical protein [Phenylobacterium sp.]MCW5759716.1 hypothetical protein [Phenylobacterium sp.]
MDKPEAATPKAPAGEKDDRARPPDSVEQLVSAIESLLPQDGANRGLPQGAQIVINFHNQGGVWNSGVATGVVVGSSEVDIDIGARSAAPGAAAPDASASAEGWFDAHADLAERSLAIAIAFLPGADLTAILAARDRLVERLAPKAEASNENPFGKSRSAQLRAVEARLETLPSDEGEDEEHVRFEDPNRYDQTRRYVWQELIDVRPRLVRWVTEQARVADTETALAFGLGVGSCAPFAFAPLLDAVIVPWVEQQPTETSLLAAGEALGAAVRSSPRANDRIRTLLQAWTGPDSPGERTACAVRLCGSSWGVAQLEDALAILHRAEQLDPVGMFGRVQRAIDLYWAWAALIPDTAETVMDQLAKGLRHWDEGDRRSIVCVLPMIHLANALRAEIDYLAAERPGERPLLLRTAFQQGAAFRAIAAWFERGLRNRSTRKFVGTSLDHLLERARALSAAAAFEALVEAMAAAAPDDDAKGRIRFFGERRGRALPTGMPGGRR